MDPRVDTMVIDVPHGCWPAPKQQRVGQKTNRTRSFGEHRENGVRCEESIRVLYSPFTPAPLPNRDARAYSPLAIAHVELSCLAYSKPAGTDCSCTDMVSKTSTVQYSTYEYVRRALELQNVRHCDIQYYSKIQYRVAPAISVYAPPRPHRKESFKRSSMRSSLRCGILSSRARRAFSSSCLYTDARLTCNRSIDRWSKITAVWLSAVRRRKCSNSKQRRRGG